jgi:predicted nucleic acid-binding protein
VILIDSSAWVEFLRGTDSTVCEAVSTLVAGDEPIATTDVVVLELLAGCHTSAQRRRLWSLLNRCRALPVRPLFDYEAAALLYSACRAAGVTPRTMTDCLIAVVAMHHETPLLHADRDFGAIATVAPLPIAQASASPPEFS